MSILEQQARRQQAEEYLAERKGRMEYRFLRYAAVSDELFARGLSDSSLLMDVGAGMCDFDFYLRTVRGWKGRYLPVDASIDGVDIGTLAWFPPSADFITAIEVVEHLTDPWAFVGKLKMAAGVAVALTTPNTDVLGEQAVRDMDRTHVTPIYAEQLTRHGFRVEPWGFFGTPEDSLLAVWGR